MLAAKSAPAQASPWQLPGTPHGEQRIKQAEVRMRRASFIISVITAIILATAGIASAQIGKSVAVAAGTPEDAAVSAIYAAQDPAQKIALLDKFSAEHATGDLALLADQLYVSAYIAEKNYDKAFEYGDKALTIDPDNFGTAVNLVRAAEQSGDSTKMLRYGDITGRILARFKASSAPAGTSAADWEQTKAEKLKAADPDVRYAEYAFYSSAVKTADAATRAQMLDHYVAAFPDSPHTKNAEIGTVLAYQAARDNAKMLDAAQKALKDDPNNTTVLVLVADYWSDRNQQLTLAEADAKKALAALPEVTKPEGLSDAQWQEQVSMQKGLALSALGEVYVNQGKNVAAIQSFQQASPLLKATDEICIAGASRWRK
jgi:tetratricopeptide (TPR) repeat protein